MKPLVVGIAGGTASGKSTITNKLAQLLGEDNVAVIYHDYYYKDLSSYGDMNLSDINFDHPDALDTPLLIEHIKQLKKYQSVDVPIYDFSTHRRKTETRLIKPREVIFIDGILIFAEKKLRDLFAIKIFVDTDADERLLRRLKRDITERGRSIDSVFQQYITHVKPMHLEFVEPSKRWADIIIPRGGENQVAIELIASEIKSMIPTDAVRNK